MRCNIKLKKNSAFAEPLSTWKRNKAFCLFLLHIWRRQQYETTLGLFCPILMKFGFFSAHFCRSPEYQISRKSVQWQPGRYMLADGLTKRIWRGRTDVTGGLDETKRRFSPKRLKIPRQQQDDLIILVTVCDGIIWGKKHELGKLESSIKLLK